MTSAIGVLARDRHGPHPSRATCETVAAGGRMPCHGIPSTGMLQDWIRRGWATEDGALRLSGAIHQQGLLLVEDAFNHMRERPFVHRDELVARIGHATTQLGLPAAPASALASLVECAIDAEALSLDQAFDAARTTAARLDAFDLVRHKEGHAATIFEARTPTGTYAINVARDATGLRSRPFRAAAH